MTKKVMLIVIGVMAGLSLINMLVGSFLISTLVTMFGFGAISIFGKEPK